MSKSSFDSTELPVLNARTHCVLMTRDPNCIYAYWDYTPQDIDNLRNKLGSKAQHFTLILRVYDITADHSWDLEVGNGVKNWYIHVPKDNADYCVELGASGENSFTPLTGSNLVHTPPKSASTRDDLIWQDIKSHKKSRPYIQQNIDKQSKKKIFRERNLSKARTYFLSTEDIHAYYGDLSLSLDQQKKLPGASWQKVQQLISSLNIISRVHPGASDNSLLESREAAEDLSHLEAGASEKLFGVQPGASEGRLNERKFFFEIWTELIVHGRTEPDAAVFLNQNNIKLNPDGTFTLRYALPDGQIPLKFIAQSADGVERRHIYTYVERAKTIGFPKMLSGPHG